MQHWTKMGKCYFVSTCVFFELMYFLSLDIVHLVRSQNFLKKYLFLPPDTHTYVFMSGGKKC